MILNGNIVMRLSRNVKAYFVGTSAGMPYKSPHKFIMWLPVPVYACWAYIYVSMEPHACKELEPHACKELEPEACKELEPEACKDGGMDVKV